jgi:hypothetical protein
VNTLRIRIMNELGDEDAKGLATEPSIGKVG